MCQPEATKISARTANCHACGQVQEAAWRSEVDRTLALILRRVARVEDAIGNVASGIASLLKEFKDGQPDVGRGARVLPTAATCHAEEDLLIFATSNPSGWKQCASQSNADDMVEDVTNPQCNQQQPCTSPIVPPCTESNLPNLVDLDNISNQSGDNNAAVGGRNRTPESVGKRVHSQPRLRVVPCARKLLGVAAEATIGEAIAGPSITKTLYTPRYKDPPGYDNIADFGGADEPQFKLPTLQPKTHGVSLHATMNP